ncbi:UDP-N-acetylglucosamine pyrophosphorylase mmy [Rhynchophorus ferrugineus]|uniref:UDP-N-acetylglucosamine pyrophosphorylase mmy n=1 Tax=Rhynchophorus ferrugineus TaxID=354439 RepID=UPI003FCC4295
MSSIVELKEKLREINQEQILKYWDQLGDEQQQLFLKQIQSIDIKNINNLFQKAWQSFSETTELLDERIQPVPDEQFGSEVTADPAELELYRNIGLKEISQGTVAVLLLAGGQGTRLGVPYPKGMYSVNLPSGKSLFQIQAERIQCLMRLANTKYQTDGKITWYLMTSGPTHATTEDFLKQNQYFGLNSDNVKLFKQGLLPCFDFNGKILLDEKHSVSLAPDGNGGIYKALEVNGILEDMKQRGIKYVHIHSVDNILVKVADPVFIGYCIHKEAECGAKVVSKQEPTEAVGVVCKVDNHFGVVEYSEITEQTANLRDSSNNLMFRAGNICNHFFTVSFLETIIKEHEPSLKLHVAKKKIPHIDSDGNKIKPTNPNGIKVEKFVFDVFEFTNKFVTWEVPRTSEFSALKNADSAGKDCPSTARRDLLQLHKTYIENAGGNVADNADVEISSLLSYAGENLEDKVKGKTFHTQSIILSDKEQ